MARFPYRPGAGAKAIRNPIYWNRLYLQEPRGRRSSTRYSKADQLRARWLNVNTNLNFFLCGWYKLVLDNAAHLTGKESESLNSILETVIDYRKTIGSSWDYMSQSNLNKFVTQIKRLFLLVFKLTIKYELFAEDEERLVECGYDRKEKDFLLTYDDGLSDRRYFMGNPAVQAIEEIKQLYRRSVEMVNDDFSGGVSAPTKGGSKPKKKAQSQKKKAIKKSRPSVSSKTKGVVEEISESGVITFKYLDCRERPSKVRNRIKLHMRVALQSYTTNKTNYSDLDEIIETIIGNALELKQEDSIKFPFIVNDKELLVFEVNRKID